MPQERPLAADAAQVREPELPATTGKPAWWDVVPLYNSVLSGTELQIGACKHAPYNSKRSGGARRAPYSKRNIRRSGLLPLTRLKFKNLSYPQQLASRLGGTLSRSTTHGGKWWDSRSSAHPTTA